MWFQVMSVNLIPAAKAQAQASQPAALPHTKSALARSDTTTSMMQRLAHPPAAQLHPTPPQYHQPPSGRISPNNLRSPAHLDHLARGALVIGNDEGEAMLLLEEQGEGGE